MKFFFPDSSDLVDPSFDFETEERSESRIRQQHDLYAHEVFDKPPMDGILVSKGIVDGVGGTSRYTLAQRQRLMRGGVREFFRLNRREQTRHLRTIGDCGAFSYVKEQTPPYTVEEVLDFYSICDFDYGMSLDHVILGFRLTLDGGLPEVNAPPLEWKRRQELTLELAQAFLSAHRARGDRCEPIGVAQGWSPDSYAVAVQNLQAMGYKYIAIGGIVPLKNHELAPVVAACSHVREPATAFHLLGVSRPHSVNHFGTQGVVSFDSTSPLRQAFKDDKDNYHTPEGSYLAVRIPQVDGNTKLRKRITAGELQAAQLRKCERRSLEMLSRFDRGQESLDSTLSSISEYYEAMEIGSERTDAYRRVLEDRPWKECPCSVCRDLGIHVIVFRGAERNRRRGFHNLFVLYERLMHELGAAR